VPETPERQSDAGRIDDLLVAGVTGQPTRWISPPGTLD